VVLDRVEAGGRDYLHHWGRLGSICMLLANRQHYC
jgi:hypothetical protein